jgi:hypothetical protein
VLVLLWRRGHLVLSILRPGALSTGRKVVFP